MDQQGGEGLSPRIALLVADARTQWAELDRRISAFDSEFVRWVRENEDARRLITIPGFGAIVASALVARSGERRPLIEVVIFRPGLASSLGS
jgi:transposase